MSGTNEWSEELALNVAQAALVERFDGHAPKPELIRLGTNGVFIAADLIVRVSPPEESEALVQQQLDFAAWLTSEGFPTSAPLDSAAERVDGLLVTFWERVRASSGRKVDRMAFGRLIRHFHELTDDYHGDLPPWEPLGRLGVRLDTVPSDSAFTEEDRAVLLRWRDELTTAVGEAEWELPSGPLHGDVHTGNLIVAETGLFLVDLDRIAFGPREWDLTQQVGAQDRFGAPYEDLDAFMSGYGWDLRRWKGVDDLVRLRLVFMTSWLLTLPRTEAVQHEIGIRMQYWRDPCRGPRWSPV